MNILSEIGGSVADEVTAADLLLPLVTGPARSADQSLSSGGVVVATLVGMTDEARTPLVVYEGQAGSAAVAARSTVDLQAGSIGRSVVMVFEGADPAKPIILGVLQDRDPLPRKQHPQTVEVECDGERMVIQAKTELVFRCGKASITLTNAGKVLIQGTYVSSRSTGVNRVKGGSVQLN
jgi:hypothetical protein